MRPPVSGQLRRMAGEIDVRRCPLPGTACCGLCRAVGTAVSGSCWWESSLPPRIAAAFGITPYDPQYQNVSAVLKHPVLEPSVWH